MRFKKYILSEAPDLMGGGPPPMGGPMDGAPPMDGGPPMGGMGGAPPMGGGPMGGGAPPMGGPPPMGGGAAAAPEPQPIPQHADVWDVLSSLLNGQPIEQEEKLQKYQSQKSQLSAQKNPMPGGPPPGMGSPLMS